jgi:hypothetical protein
MATLVTQSQNNAASGKPSERNERRHDNTSGRPTPSNG